VAPSPPPAAAVHLSSSASGRRRWDDEAAAIRSRGPPATTVFFFSIISQVGLFSPTSASCVVVVAVAGLTGVSMTSAWTPSDLFLLLAAAGESANLTLH
jgi:hypothetical protein